MENSVEIINNLAIRIANLEVEKAVLASENKQLKEQLELNETGGQENESSI